MISKVEEHDTLGGLRSSVPGGKCPQTTWNEARFGNTKEETTGNERAIVVLPRLEDTDDTKEEKLKGEPLSGANSVQEHVGWDFKKHDTEREHLLANVELILGNPDILEEIVGQGVGDVSSIEF